MAPPYAPSRPAVLSALGALVLALAACPPRRAPTNDGVEATGSDSFPTDFTPGAPLPPPDPPDPSQFGLSYLEQMAPRVQAGWTQFLEDCRLRLPPQHPLNSPTLSATVAMTVDGQGGLVAAELITPSGNAEYDEAALAVARDAAPFPAVDVALRSDDDHVYVTWLFARDRRQAGTATASLQRVEWSLDRAVPKFLDDGNLAEAARRVARAAGDAPDAQVLGFGERVMIAAVREGLASADAGVQRLAIQAAADAKIRPAARELRAIADGAMDVSLRGAAIAALASVGDADAAPLLVAILERDAGANAELTGSAARALVELGAGAEAVRVASAWLADGKPNKTAAQKARLWAALIAGGGVALPRSITDLGRLVGSGDTRVRGGACRALGTIALTDGAAWKALGRGLADPDALVRAQCAGAAAEAAAAGGRSRATFWLVAPLLRDRDDRVRAAAVLALVRLDAPRGAPELAAIARDRSPLVQASLAEAWVRAGDVDRAAALLAHEAVAVRLAAAKTLLALGNDAARGKLAAHTDADPAVRAVAIAAVTDRAALEAASTDADPAIAMAAARRLVILDGRARALVPTATAIAEAPPASAARVHLAGAWLAAR